MMAAMMHGDGIVAQTVRRNAWVTGLVLVHWIATVLVARSVGLSVHNDAIDVLMMMFGTVIPAFLFVLLLWRCLHMLRHVQPRHPIAWLLADIRATVMDPDRLLDGFITLGVLSIFFANFSLMKLAIPLINPFGWDLAIANLDRALHGGTDVWQLLWPIFGGPKLLALLSGAYVAWLFVLYFIVFVACFTRSNPQARLTFLIAFVMTWTLSGNVLATCFASVGPAFFAPLGLGDRFEPLMTNLRAVNEIYPLPSLSVQDMLWNDYKVGTPITGISAFPSMHVASSVLMALYGFSYTRLAGLILSLFATTIMIASVVLGWHYAVDGYLGALCAIACWKLAALAAQSADPVAKFATK